MGLSANINEKANLIWAIADKLTGVYKPHEYGEVILPLTVIRRFDCILADTNEAVWEKYESIKALPMQKVLLETAAKHPFYNISHYTFERLINDPDNIEENFHKYLNGFSENVRDIIAKFKFDAHITTMANKGILYIVLKEFTTPKANLHPAVISNLEMGYIFEEIIRRFSEAHNEDAGQHYTPREVIKLMVNILFHDDNPALSGNNVAKTIYEMFLNLRSDEVAFLPYISHSPAEKGIHWVFRSVRTRLVPRPRNLMQTSGGVSFQPQPVLPCFPTGRRSSRRKYHYSALLTVHRLPLS